MTLEQKHVPRLNEIAVEEERAHPREQSHTTLQKLNHTRLCARAKENNPAFVMRSRPLDKDPTWDSPTKDI